MSDDRDPFDADRDDQTGGGLSVPPRYRPDPGESAPLSYPIGDPRNPLTGTLTAALDTAGTGLTPGDVASIITPRQRRSMAYQAAGCQDCNARTYCALWTDGDQEAACDDYKRALHATQAVSDE